LNEKRRGEERFAHFLYVLDPMSHSVGIAQVPYGAVVYHDRHGGRFLSLKDPEPGENTLGLTAFKLADLH